MSLRKLRSLNIRKRIRDFQISKIAAIHIFIFMVSFNIFLLGIDRMPIRIHDEEHNLNGAIGFINQDVKWNWSLPPLGEIILASGITMFGDNALGWRIMGVFFGALTLNAMFILGMVFFRKTTSALEVALLCLLNQILFVQARIATFDIFMFSFIAWGFVFFFKYLEKPKGRDLLLTGLFFGLATACKWFAIIPALFCLLYYLFYDPKTWKKRIKDVAVNLVGVPALIYLVVFSLCFGMSLPSFAPRVGDSTVGVLDFIALHVAMFKTQLGFGNPSHPFASAWYTWPLSFKQFWYDRGFININGKEYLNGIILIGNPLILTCGFASVFLSVYYWVKKKNKTAKMIALVFMTLFLSWAVIPRKTTYFYYYFPASMILSLSLVFAFETLKLNRSVRIAFIVLCTLCFFFFYPALASLHVPSDSVLYYVLTR